MQPPSIPNGGRIRNLRGDKKGAFDDVKKSIELNPQGEMAQLCNGQHSNFDNLYKGGIFLNISEADVCFIRKKPLSLQPEIVE